MTFSHKLKKLAQPLTYRRTWRRVQRWLRPIPLRPLLAKIDRDRLHDIQARYASSSEYYAKYLDLKRYLKLNIERVQDLNLHRSPPQDVLDVGCGGGIFLFILKQFGHRGVGVDIDEFPLFAELVDLVGVRRKIWRIRAFEPSPDLEQKFDWITAFSTAFHGGDKKPWCWGTKEWAFFLDDLEQHLKPGGRIFLALNPSYGGHYYTPEILDLFLSRGGTVERENVLFVLK